FLTLLNICPIKEALAPFANPIIFLFLGSFILARAMCVHRLDQKLAYSVLSLKSIAHKRTRILLALGLTSMVLSMWISNTATTAMMFPIALGILEAFPKEELHKGRASFGVVLLLTLAYSASVGGIGTPIGSPPNLIAIGMLEKFVDYRVNFFQWMVLGFLVLIPMFVVLYFFMRSQIKTQGETVKAKIDISHLKSSVNPGLNRAQRNVLIAFSVTVFLWIFPGIISLTMGREAPLYLWLHARFPEAVAAMIGAGLLFFLPVNLSRGEFTLTLKEALKVDWGTLLLFGGGLSLGFQMFETGLADAIGRYFISLGGNSASLALITFLSVALSVFLTELTSNTASANMIIPIIIAISLAASVNPLPPVLGCAIGCSFAFMLPVATPPNAIIYGSGMIRLPQMMRYGFWLNLAGILIIWLSLTFLAPFLGII
ncbi:MAG: DASS family sodium-coupled anion symporter, partial [Candidatus Aminicenantes bacterium]|nr:DASS family sodium-coupled anion symporter [Candidatus Aminicenantes bacterium]